MSRVPPSTDAGPAGKTEAGEGVSFPLLDGARSTSVTGRAILADAAAAVDGALAERISASPRWRSDYVAFVRELTEASATAPGSLAIAGAGLASLRERMVMDSGGEELPLEEALSLPEGSCGTGSVTGAGSAVRELSVPYRGRLLAGAQLLEQLERWTAEAVVEPSFAQAIARVVKNPGWLALDGRRVALIGAGAEMSPLEPLSAWGADVLAVDLPLPDIWQRVERVAAAGAGTLSVPIAADGTRGLDIIRSPSRTRRWLEEAAGEQDLVLAMHAYADGGTHVRVSAAFDIIAAGVLAERPDTTLAFLATPTDAYVVPGEVVEHARAAYAGRRLRRIAQAPLQLASRGRLYAPAYSGEGAVADVLVPQQGPNYALAKRIQRWRGVTAADQGHAVSFNVAPATLTRSVTSNRLLAAAYAGAGRFGIEIFAPETSRVLMAAALVHDLHSPAPTGRHPEELFSDGAAHGGLWRAGYEPRSVLGIAAVAGAARAVRR